MALLTKVVGRLPRSWITSVARLQWRHPHLKRAVRWAADYFRNQDSVIQQGAGCGLKFNTGELMQDICLALQNRKCKVP